jgi:glutamate racemase
VIGDDAVIVDSASTTARTVAKILDERGLRRIGEPSSEGSSRLQLLATDGPGRFARVGGLFLEAPVSADDIELVDI